MEYIIVFLDLKVFIASVGDNSFGFAFRSLYVHCTTFSCCLKVGPVLQMNRIELKVDNVKFKIKEL